MVDQKKIAFRAAEKLSFLTETEQNILLEAILEHMSDTEGNDIPVSKTELDVFLKIVDKLFENAGDKYHQDSYDT